jgi:hypothetical protein
MPGVAPITTTVEMKQPILFIDGNPIISVGGSYVHAVEKWDDISADVVTSKQWNYTRGISGIKPTSRVASPGKFTFYLLNRAENSGGVAGFYSIGHSNQRDGFEQGVEIRIKHVYSSSTDYKWRGKIYDPDPTASPYKSFTRTVCYDWMREAQDHKFKATAMATSQRADQAIQTMLDTLPVSRQPEATSLATGKSIFPYVFDSERDEKSSIMSVLQKAAQTELGKVYVNGQGGNGEQLVFENRHYMIDETTVQQDFDDNIVSVNPVYPFDLIKTKIITRVFPREVTTGLVLGQVQKSFSIPANETRTVKLYFRDPETGDRISANALTTRVSGTDFVANADEDGGGANKTAALSVTDNEVSANSISLSCANSTGNTIWVTTLQQQGDGIMQYDPVTYEAEANGTYLAEKGERVLRYDLPYEDDYNVGVDFGEYLLSIWQDPVCQIDELTYYPEESSTLAQAFMDIDLGHRITVNFTQLGIDQDYFVRKINVSWDRGLLKCAYGVTPAQAGVYMQLNDAIYAKLGEVECKLAF